MHQKSFSGWAPPGRAGGAYSAPIDRELGENWDPRDTGERIGWEGGRRGNGMTAKEAHYFPDIQLYIEPLIDRP